MTDNEKFVQSLVHAAVKADYQSEGLSCHDGAPLDDIFDSGFYQATKTMSRQTLIEFALIPENCL